MKAEARVFSSCHYQARLRCRPLGASTMLWMAGWAPGRHALNRGQVLWISASTPTSRMTSGADSPGQRDFSCLELVGLPHVVGGVRGSTSSCWVTWWPGGCQPGSWLSSQAIKRHLIWTGVFKALPLSVLSMLKPCLSQPLSEHTAESSSSSFNGSFELSSIWWQHARWEWVM